jgi:hypothetical protein
MTCFPAFRDRHPPQEIVAIAVFASALPGLAAEEYDALAGPANESPDEARPAAGGQPDRQLQPETGELSQQ